MGYTKCYVMFWSTSQKHEKDAIYVSDLAKSAYFINIETENGNKIVKQFVKL